MKDTKVVIEERNKMQECVKKIRKEIDYVRPNGSWDTIPAEIRRYLGNLYQLKLNYENQIKGINFCLNEDSELDDYCWNYRNRDSELRDIEEFLFKNTK